MEGGGGSRFAYKSSCPSLRAPTSPLSQFPPLQTPLPSPPTPMRRSVLPFMPPSLQPLGGGAAHAASPSAAGGKWGDLKTARDPPGAPQRPPPPPKAAAWPHLAGEGDEGGLHLCVVGVLEEVVGLKDVVGFHSVVFDGPQEVPNVLQLPEISARGSALRVPTPPHPTPCPACRTPPPQPPPHLMPVLDGIVHLLH